MRISGQEQSDLVNLALGPAKHALIWLGELDRTGHQFEKRHMSRKFATSAQQTYREVDTASGADAVSNYGLVFGNDIRRGVKILYGDLDGFEELVTYVRSHPSLIEFLEPSGGRDEFKEHALRVSISELPVAAAEYHIYNVGWDVDDKILRDELENLVAWWATEPFRVTMGCAG